MRTERIFILSSLLTIGLAIMAALQRGDLAATGGASQVNLTLGAALVLVAAGGSVWLRQRPRNAAGTLLAPEYLPIVPIPVHTLLPALLLVGYAIFMQLFSGSWFEVAVIGLAWASFVAVYWALAHSADTTDHYFSLAQTALNVCGHLTAFLLYSTLYGLKVRALYSATAVGVVTMLLVYEMLARDASWHRALGRPVEGRRSTQVILSVAVGLVLGQLTWGLNYWAALTTLIGGACLLLALYATYGVVSAYVDQRLTRSTLLEYGGVGAVGLLAVFASAFFGQ
ncbi:MAG: hypothetical protein QOH93_3078 [Chloroflexia bacterium]|jgi:hypothetical protein|nr:hypothetical protein [Chloroflexia bacterium]